MSKKKGTIHLTEEQYRTVDKMEKDGHKDILDEYAEQAYEYGIKDGTDYGIVGSALAILAGFGAAKLITVIRSKIVKK